MPVDDQRRKSPVDTNPLTAKRLKGGNRSEPDPSDGIVLGPPTNRGHKGTEKHSYSLEPSETMYADNILSSGSATIRDDGKKDTEKIKGEMTEEEKSMKRRAANRISALRSRQRRIEMIEELQWTAASISNDNELQREEIELLKGKLASVQQENTELHSALMASRSENPRRFISECFQQASEGSVVAAPVAHSEGERTNEIVSLVLELDRVEQQIQFIQQHAESSDACESDASLSRNTSVKTNPQEQDEQGFDSRKHP